MRRATLLTLCIFFISGGLAYGTIVDSSHDFSLNSTGANFKSDNESEICIFCHTPHNASGTPLWNRNISNTSGYNMYNSPTMNATRPSAPTGVSLLCMSCHDGVSAINVLVNYGTVNPIIMNQNRTKLGDLSYPPSNDPNLTKDLSNDHPVSFTYDTALANADGGIYDPAVTNIAPLKLYNSKLECATCHDPHEEGTTTGMAPFLRMSNSSSYMCLKCHNK
jgi:hypothetical protein